MTVSFRRRAKNDVIEAAEFYEVKRPQLGNDFVKRFLECVELIADFPLAHAIVHRNVRRALLTDFP